MPALQPGNPPEASSASSPDSLPFTHSNLQASVRIAEDVVRSRAQHLRSRLQQPGMSALLQSGEKMLQQEREVLFLRAMCMHAMGRIRAALHVYAMAFATDDKHVGYHQMAWAAAMGAKLDEPVASCSLDSATAPLVKECFAKRLGKSQRPTGFRDPPLAAVRPDSVPVPVAPAIAGRLATGATSRAHSSHHLKHSSSPVAPSSGSGSGRRSEAALADGLLEANMVGCRGDLSMAPMQLRGELAAPDCRHRFGRLPPLQLDASSSPGSAGGPGGKAQRLARARYESFEHGWMHPRAMLWMGRADCRTIPAPLVGYGESGVTSASGGGATSGLPNVGVCATHWDPVIRAGGL